MQEIVKSKEITHLEIELPYRCGLQASEIAYMYPDEFFGDPEV